MRQAWGTIRERLGLRPSTASPTNNVSRTPLQQDGHPEVISNRVSGDLTQSGPDTRELMLAEMARAFNIGLGLNGLGGLNPSSNQSGQASSDGAADTDGLSDGNNPPTENSVDNTSPRSQSGTTAPRTTLPPEGSFERFLVDLQNDLRIALTQPEDETALPGTHSNTSQTQAEPQTSATLPAGLDAPLSLTPTMATQDLPVDNDENQPELNASHVPEVVHDNDDTYAEMPFLEAVSDSESEFDDAENHYEEDEDGTYVWFE